MTTYMDKPFFLGDREVGPDHPPLVIAEIGINHEGSIEKARQMIDDAAATGCECVKFQRHVIEDEMIPNDVIPGNAKESIWDIMERCALTLDEDISLKRYTEEKGMIYLSTPFSRAAANELREMNVGAYKIGSGECNNYPLVEHIASFGSPVILSTGMNDLASIERSVDILRAAEVPFLLLHCTSIYPTPYSAVRLGAMQDMKDRFQTEMVGLSDHTLDNYAALAAVALGAVAVERHFTSDKSWPGPDISISMSPPELADLVKGAKAIFEARGGSKDILEGEAPTIAFAYASVVATRAISKGEEFTRENIWVKRPGTGEILATEYEAVVGKTATRALEEHEQLSWNCVSD